MKISGQIDNGQVDNYRPALSIFQIKSMCPQSQLILLQSRLKMTTFQSKYPALKRYPSQSQLSFLKDIPPLIDPVLKEIDWDSKPTRDLFQQLIEEFDSRRQSPTSMSPQKEHMEVQEPSTAPISSHGCKCSKIGCLKLYCECFTRGELCGSSCVCVDCENCVGHEKKVLLAQQMANFRKPGTFLGVAAFVPERKCTCKKSKCQKKYCECFNAGFPCTGSCECIGCENHGHSEHRHGGRSPYMIEIEAPA